MSKVYDYYNKHNALERYDNITCWDYHGPKKKCKHCKKVKK